MSGCCPGIGVRAFGWHGLAREEHVGGFEGSFSLGFPCLCYVLGGRGSVRAAKGGVLG
jgi:hypothetical protein